MTKKHLQTEGKVPQKPKPQPDSKPKDHAHQSGENEAITNLQQQVGNQAVQRLLLQRSGNEAVDLDEETADQINNERGGGQPLDSQVQKQMGGQFGQDFQDVRTHTSPKADKLNKEVGAEAFTTGKDIFFRDGAYDPNSGAGKQLIAHELTHVVQQSEGSMGSTGKMKVNPPGDKYEKEADSVSQAVLEDEDKAVQRQEIPEEEEALQSQPVEEEEEEEPVQTQVEEEEEEELQASRLQRQEEEEEALEPKRIQRQEEEEEMMQPRLQRQEEEELQTSRLQRQEEEELQMQEEEELQMQEEEEEMQMQEEEEEAMPKRA